MKAPGFWYRRAGAMAMLLDPAAAVFELGGLVRHRLATPHKAAVPVICVGNLVAGGAGKTPIVIALCRRLQAAGVDAHVLTRGYRGRERGPVLVDPGRHGARDVGDEPLLLSAHAPTWVARDRPAGAEAAIAAGAGAIVMDDGFQNPTLAKDLSLLVVDGQAAFGNGRVIPAGPLREPIGRGLARADAVVVMGEDTSGVGRLLGEGPRPVLFADLVVEGEAERWRGQKLLAFAGIGRPEKFFDMLLRLGCRLDARIAFPDHHVYQPDEVMRMIDLAAAGGAALVTTAKDFVRLPADVQPLVRVLAVRVAWRDDGAIDRLLGPLAGVAQGGTG